jgi:hypothetical protein
VIGKNSVSVRNLRTPDPGVNIMSRFLDFSFKICYANLVEMTRTVAEMGRRDRARSARSRHPPHHASQCLSDPPFGGDESNQPIHSTRGISVGSFSGNILLFTTGQITIEFI